MVKTHEEVEMVSKGTQRLPSTYIVQMRKRMSKRQIVTVFVVSNLNTWHVPSNPTSFAMFHLFVTRVTCAVETE